jgi:serine/threonine-protein kinase RsbW
MVLGNRLNINLSLPADTSAVAHAVAATRDFAQAIALAAGPSGRLAIIVEELVANLVDHTVLTPADRIELALVHEGGVVHLVLTDPAAPFDPRLAPMVADLPTERGGGAGLALVRAFAESIDYQRRNGRNRLELRLSR